ncbi:MAG: OB-fold domain-containing protein [Mycobacterium sp.]|nr:OB-fold domain-containing protein [Mycobacterium sp.]
MAQRRPNRVLGDGHDEFWRYTAQSELRLQRCSKCGELNWPATADVCEFCGQRQFTWEKMSGRGKLVSWCTIHQKYYDNLDTPWDTILVELDEGPWFISDPSGFTNDEATANMPVKVAFLDCEDDAGPFRLPVFERI